jgi:cell shape-determining protein MreC
MAQLKQRIQSLICVLITTTAEAVRGVAATFRSSSTLAAENLFLCKELAFYQERQSRPRRLTDDARFSLALWSRCLIGRMHW